MLIETLGGVRDLGRLAEIAAVLRGPFQESLPRNADHTVR